MSPQFVTKSSQSFNCNKIVTNLQNCNRVVHNFTIENPYNWQIVNKITIVNVYNCYKNDNCHKKLSQFAVLQAKSQFVRLIPVGRIAAKLQLVKPFTIENCQNCYNCETTEL